MTDVPLQAATSETRPRVKPIRPQFSSGPCVKRPGWSPEVLSDASLGRSHRSKPAKAKLKAVIDDCRALLGVPDDYRIGIVPASDTGAVELALWSLLGPRGVDLFAWESFGAGWVSDTLKQLKLDDARVFEADYGELPDLSQYDGARDCVFTWNGTTAGVRVPDADWIPSGRDGLTICDATSAAFAMDLAWDKLDVTTFSWQKVMGGEAAHGMIVLSPRAVERLESYTPPWPMPKIFRLTKGGKLIEGIFEGATINTPSLLATEDFLDTLGWGKSIGGLAALKARVNANAAAINAWVEASDWVTHLAEDPVTRSTTSVCLIIDDPWFLGLTDEEKTAAAKKIANLLDAEGIAFDLGSYRDAPPGIRLWAGATMETSDLEALFPWLDWAFGLVKSA